MALSFYDHRANLECPRFPATLRASLQVFENSRVLTHHHPSDNPRSRERPSPSRASPLKATSRQGYRVGASRASSDARVD